LTRADFATIGFAISLVTAASVAFADCFFGFPLPMRSSFQKFEHCSDQFGSTGQDEIERKAAVMACAAHTRL